LLENKQKELSLLFNNTYHEDHPSLQAHSPLYGAAFQAGTSARSQSEKSHEKLLIYACTGVFSELDVKESQDFKLMVKQAHKEDMRRCTNPSKY
jgi:hypothetical protein